MSWQIALLVFWVTVRRDIRGVLVTPDVGSLRVVDSGEQLLDRLEGRSGPVGRKPSLLSVWTVS